jgi:hypothetical protein
VLPEKQGATDIRVTPDIGVGCGVLHLGERLHRLAPFGSLGVINDQGDGFSLAGMEDTQQCLGLLMEGCLGIPALDQEEVIEAGPVVRSIQIPIQVGDIPSPPHKGDGKDQQAKVGEMIPIKVPSQGLKKLVKRGGNPSDAEHEAILLKPVVHGRLHTLPSQGPRMASAAATVKTVPPLPPKKPVKMRMIPLRDNVERKSTRVVSTATWCALLTVILSRRVV